jgi:transcriptional regulator with XRE-family HTH domain
LSEPDAFRSATGRALRRARLRAGLTLRGVRETSGGRFTPSAIGGYERGERALSLDRFCDLALLYDIPPERLLSQILDLWRPQPHRRVLDLTASQTPEKKLDG